MLEQFEGLLLQGCALHNLVFVPEVAVEALFLDSLQQIVIECHLVVPLEIALTHIKCDAGGVIGEFEEFQMGFEIYAAHLGEALFVLVVDGERVLYGQQHTRTPDFVQHHVVEAYTLIFQQFESRGIHVKAALHRPEFLVERLKVQPIDGALTIADSLAVDLEGLVITGIDGNLLFVFGKALGGGEDGLLREGEEIERVGCQ